MNIEISMNCFRNNERLNLLCTDDKLEIFKTILLGAPDITKNLLDELIVDCYVDNVEVIVI